MDMIIDGIALCQDLGCIVERRPTFKKPKRRITPIITEGVDGSKSEFFGYESYSLQFAIVPTDVTKFNQIYALLDGPRVLVCSDDLTNYRNVEFNDEIEYGTLALWKKAEVTFFVPLPFRYVLSEATQTITTFPTTVVNIGTTISRPLLKVTGLGTVILVLNGVTFQYIYPGGETYFYLDCDSGETYYNLPTVLRNRSITIPTIYPPTLSVGNNTLSITSGTVSEIIVTKRTCYL